MGTGKERKEINKKIRKKLNKRYIFLLYSKCIKKMENIGLLEAERWDGVLESVA